MFPKWISFVLKYCTLWGFYSPPCSSLQSKLFSFPIFCLHFGLCTWCSLNYIKSFFHMQRLIEFLDVLNFLFYYVNCAIAYWFIIYDSYSKRKVQHAFWNIFERINEGSSSFSTSKIANCSCLAIFIKLSIADILIFFLSIIGDNLSSSSDKIVHFIYTCVIDNRTFYFLLHMKLIAIELQKINARFPVFHQNKQSSEVMRNVIDIPMKKTRSYYQSVYEMCQNANQIFGWSQLTLIILCFQSFVTFLNYTYSRTTGKIILQNYGTWLTT